MLARHRKHEMCWISEYCCHQPRNNNCDFVDVHKQRRRTALHPPPPTPTTLMTQGESPPSGITAKESAAPVMGRAVVLLMVPPLLSRSNVALLVAAALLLALRRVIPAKDPRSGCHPLATAEENEMSSSFSLRSKVSTLAWCTEAGKTGDVL